MAEQVALSAEAQQVVEIVKKLLTRNIPLAVAPNRYGWTPAHAAAANGHASMIDFLAKSGVGLNGRTLSGKSPANLASENSLKEVLDALARLGAAAVPGAQGAVSRADYAGRRAAPFRPGHRLEPRRRRQPWRDHLLAGWDGNLLEPEEEHLGSEARKRPMDEAGHRPVLKERGVIYRR